MPTKDPRIDTYIAKSGEFARPILKYIRKAVHVGCPDVVETLKWGMPSFTHEGILCNMAAFKAHCTFGFWKHELMFGKTKIVGKAEKEGMGQFGRITDVSQLPKESVLIKFVKEAVRLNEAGIKAPAAPKSKVKKELVIPDYFTAILKKNKKAQAAFEAFSYSHKKEYVEWITEAKTEETRNRRIATTLEWLTQGKSRHWKYQNC